MLTVIVILLSLLTLLTATALFMLSKQKHSFKKDIEETLRRSTDNHFKSSLELMFQQNERGVSSTLQPLQNSIKLLSDQTSALSKDSTVLKEQIHSLKDAHKLLEREAQTLSSTLKGDKKAAGIWGERVLSSILDLSGLVKGREYNTEVSVSVDHKMRRLDAVINLPENQHLIIDAKTPLTAYEKIVSSPYSNSEESSNLEKEVANAIKNHIKELSAKEYFKADSLNSLQFVFMFLPLEGVLSFALKSYPTLLEFAWSKNVIITTPTSLLASLKTVSLLWTQNKYNKNAEQIAIETGKLCDKISSIVSECEKMKRQTTTLLSTQDTIYNRLHEGRDNVMTKIEKIKELGAKSSHQR